MRKAKITRAHYTDLVCAGMNDPDCQVILDELLANTEFDIVEQPIPGEFYQDFSVSFMYPHSIKVLAL